MPNRSPTSGTAAAIGCSRAKVLSRHRSPSYGSTAVGARHDCVPDCVEQVDEFVQRPSRSKPNVCHALSERSPFRELSPRAIRVKAKYRGGNETVPSLAELGRSASVGAPAL